MLNGTVIVPVSYASVDLNRCQEVRKCLSTFFFAQSEAYVRMLLVRLEQLSSIPEGHDFKIISPRTANITKNLYYTESTEIMTPIGDTVRVTDKHGSNFFHMIDGELMEPFKSKFIVRSLLNLSTANMIFEGKKSTPPG